jgi:8-oxo-dGTP pyrophosphatase MutT (NUDIX family)
VPAPKYGSGVCVERRVRRATRVVVVSTDRTVLLLRGGDPRRPDAGTWWFTPGGGLEDNETPEEAGRRELAEETGLELNDDLGPVVMQRSIEFEFDGVIYEQTEDYYLVRTAPFELDNSRWSPIEVATVVEHRWWPIDELRTTPEVVYPEELIGLLDRAQ